MARTSRKGTVAGPGCVTVFITAPSLRAAEKIARGLVRAKLAACASVLRGLKSLFWWEGRIGKANEALIICKTMQSLVGKLTEFVCENHEYQVPEVIAIPIIGGNPDYLKWIKESTVE